MLTTAPTFTPSPYILLQAVTSTPIYTMEVNNSFGRIDKFNERPGTVSLKEVKATFSTMVYELELKYAANYTEAFIFKQLVRYVHYEALDVDEQHFPRILGVTQIPNLTYAIAITTVFQAALQVAIAHHGTMPNNPNMVPTLVNLFP
jgi:carbamoylphosphate synthase large subunit